MKHDPFDFTGDMTVAARAWRVAFLLAVIGVVLLDLFFWRAQ
jgi:hypothetical protein|tara:strand:- start:20141 stop:20266 length:126 start_codon:yes stop_codon:yes gene_type:complete